MSRPTPLPYWQYRWQRKLSRTVWWCSYFITIIRSLWKKQWWTRRRTYRPDCANARAPRPWSCECECWLAMVPVRQVQWCARTLCQQAASICVDTKSWHVNTRISVGALMQPIQSCVIALLWHTKCVPTHASDKIAETNKMVWSDTCTSTFVQNIAFRWTQISCAP